MPDETLLLTCKKKKKYSHQITLRNGKILAQAVAVIDAKCTRDACGYGRCKENTLQKTVGQLFSEPSVDSKHGMNVVVRSVDTC